MEFESNHLLYGGDQSVVIHGDDNQRPDIQPLPDDLRKSSHPKINELHDQLDQLDPHSATLLGHNPLTLSRDFHSSPMSNDS